SLGPIPPPVHHRPLAYWLLDRDTGVGASGWGAIGSNVMALAGRFPNGDGFDTRRTPRASTGPDFCKFLIGTEGYFAVPTEATLIVTPLPESRRHQSHRMRSIGDALTILREIVVQGLRPTFVNVLDGAAARAFLGEQSVEPTGALLTVGFEGPTTIAQVGEELASKLAESEGGKPAGNELAERWRRLAWSPEDPGAHGEGLLDDRYTISIGWRNAEALHTRLRRSFWRDDVGLRVIFGQAGIDGLQAVVQIDGGERYDAEETRQELLRQIAEVGGELVHELQGGDSVPVDREAEYGVALEWLSAIGDRLDPAGIYQGAVW
ncbi:MAG: FAD-binding oxidoreductase, partial [Myxococcales bacterium]|nr:FAD-binding oxidoreductase [Myxococcales bacterium]